MKTTKNQDFIEYIFKKTNLPTEVKDEICRMYMRDLRKFAGVPRFEDLMSDIKKNAKCNKCGDEILSDEDSLCGRCV